MTNNNINLYEKTAEKHKKPKKKLHAGTLPFEITEYFMAFFMNKIILFGAISPFGISYFAATFPMHEMSFGTIAAFLGIIFMGFGINSLKYIGALALYLLFMMLYNKDVSDKQWVSALAASVSLFTVGMIFNVTNGFLLYDIMLLSLETIFSFLSFFAFNKASMLIRSFKTRKILEAAETLSLVFLFAALLLSVSTIPNLEGAGHVLAVAVILIVSLSSGFHISASTGIILGTVMSINSVLPAQVICTYTISALSAGLFRRYGKIGVSLAFIFSNALVTLYINSSSLTIIDIFCTLSATLIVLIMPKSFFIRLSEISTVPLSSNKENTQMRAVEMVTNKLSKTSSSFYELGNIFSHITEETAKANELTAEAIFSSVFDSVCKNCTLCTYCWHKNYENTTYALSEMFTSMSNRGCAVEFDAPCDFRTECIHFDDFLESVNINYEIHKINISWASKVSESKALVAQQFKNISFILNNMMNKLSSGFECDTSLEKKISSELDKKGITATNIKVILTDCYEITLTISPEINNRTNLNLIAATIGSCIGIPVFSVLRNCSQNECFLKFTEKANFSVEVGFAKTSPDGGGKSGDSHAFLPIEDGKYILCLSDGMGHGKNAAGQSKITTELIKRLLTLGFDKETALKIINTFLLLKSQNETYATADVCVINLYSGALEFIKSGAVSSFIKCADKISEVRCSSLPAGAISNLSADCELEYAKDGDYIIMVTDGISDVLETEGNNILKGIIEDFSGNSPQDLANEIINTAIKFSSKGICDDMTVLVSKINEEM